MTRFSKKLFVVPSASLIAMPHHAVQQSIHDTAFLPSGKRVQIDWHRNTDPVQSLPLKTSVLLTVPFRHLSKTAHFYSCSHPSQRYDRRKQRTVIKTAGLFADRKST